MHGSALRCNKSAAQRASTMTMRCSGFSNTLCSHTSTPVLAAALFLHLCRLLPTATASMTSACASMATLRCGSTSRTCLTTCHSQASLRIRWVGAALLPRACTMHLDVGCSKAVTTSSSYQRHHSLRSVLMWHCYVAADCMLSILCCACWSCYCVAAQLPSHMQCVLCLQIFCLHGGLSPTLDTLDHIRALDRVQEVRGARRTAATIFSSREHMPVDAVTACFDQLPGAQLGNFGSQLQLYSPGAPASGQQVI